MFGSNPWNFEHSTIWGVQTFNHTRLPKNVNKNLIDGNQTYLCGSTKLNSVIVDDAVVQANQNTNNEAFSHKKWHSCLRYIVGSV